MSAGSFRSPFAALVWKEWRESWWLLILTVIGPAALYLGCVALEADGAVTETTMVGLPAFALWLLALCLGAGLFAGESAKGTSVFQEERPVSRAAIWTAKFLMPILALAAGEILFLLTIDWLYRPESWRSGHGIVPFMFLVMGFLFFASAVLCSVLLDRPVTAWAAGGVLCFVLMFFQAGFFEHFVGSLSHTDISRAWLLYLTLLTIEAIGLLWLSRVAYVRWKHD